MSQDFVYASLKDSQSSIVNLDDSPSLKDGNKNESQYSKDIEATHSNSANYKNDQQDDISKIQKPFLSRVLEFVSFDLGFGGMNL